MSRVIIADSLKYWACGAATFSEYGRVEEVNLIYEALIPEMVNTSSKSLT